MAGTLHRLSARQIATAPAGANLNDGGGLFYRATRDAGTGKWIFRFTSRDPDYVARQEARGSKTRQRDMGLGTFPAVSLADARKIASRLRAAVAEGRDPIEDERREGEAAQVRAVALAREQAEAEMTFGRYADECFLPKMLPRFSNPAHIQQWRATFATHAKALRDKPLAGITREDVLAVLLPIWGTKNVTASRSRERIERLFSHAIQNGRYHGDNPAAWRQFDQTLPPPKKLTRGHHPGIDHEQAAAFLAAVREKQADSLAALMLEWIMLSACRTGEARFAVWNEIDLDQMVWRVPAERMKMRRDHEVPITERMVEILAILKDRQGAHGGAGEYVFSETGRKPLSEMAALMLMRRLPGFQKYTVHGLRSTFKGWAASQTAFPRELIEEQLAHQLGPVERAYMRVSTVDRRRPMMEAWACHCEGETDQGSGNVVALTPGRGA